MGGVSMNCMKCGRDVNNDQVFCSKCLELMEQRPVKPDVVVKLPVRHEGPLKKPQPRKKTRTPEEQIQRLRRKNRWLTAIICLLLAVTIALGYLSADFFHQLDVQKFLGQNYSTAEPAN